MTKTRFCLLLVFLSACGDGELHYSGEYAQNASAYARDFGVEAQARHERSIARERFRARGYRVCEEGDEGKQWKEDCNTCRCEYGSVRSCTKAHCRHHSGDLITPQSPGK